MYIWKCWRDTRMLFLVSLAVAIVVLPGSMLILGHGFLTDQGDWVPAKTSYLPAIGPASVSLALSFVTSLAAIGLGVLGASEQFGDKTVHFLYTKPRSRPYFVWTNWAVGFVELLAVALVNISAGLIVLIHYNQHSAPALRLLELINGRTIIGTLTYCVWLYSLCYSLTAIFRNGLHGLGASIISVSFFQAAAIVIRARWQIHVPIPPERIGMMSSLTSKSIWTLVALSFVFGAQFFVERVEI